MAVIYMFPLTSPWMVATQGDLDHMKSAVQVKQQTSVLIGSSEVGKTSLLFQSAVTHAAENLTVTFICREPLSRLPLSVHGMPSPDPAVLQSLKFIYMSDVNELINWCANVHMIGCLPDVLIVDDIDVYGSQIKERGLEHGVATVLAVLVDAAAYIRQKNGKCSLLMSATDRAKSLHSVYRQFNLATNFIQASKDCDKEFVLTTKVKDDRKLSVTFGMEESQIRLKHQELHSTQKPPD